MPDKQTPKDTKDKPESPVSAFLKKHFPGKHFFGHAGTLARLLKTKGEEVARDYAAKKVRDEKLDFRPPAKCQIVAWSRDFSEWPIARASATIQQHVSGLTKEDFERFDPGKSKAAHDAWFQESGVDCHGYRHVQGLNLIFANARDYYEGVVKKVENKNAQRRRRVEALNARRAEEGEEPIPLDVEESPFGEDGRLAHPPGVNPSIYVYQAVSPRPLKKSDLETVVLPPAYAGYDRDPSAPIPVMGDRLSIPEGQRGHVPAWQRDQLSPDKHRRMRAWYSAANTKPKPGRTSVPDAAAIERARAEGALLVVIRIGEDWVVLDARGLLRNARWRRIADKEISLDGLLDLFTGDPVIDSKRNVVTFIYKAEHATATSRKVVHRKASRKALLDMTSPGEDGLPREVALASVDLGQTNAAAVRYARVHREGDDITSECLVRELLPDEISRDIARYRAASDRMEAEIREAAIAGLPEPMQAEVRAADASSPEAARAAVVALVGDGLPWEKMSSATYHISDALVALGRGREAYLLSKSKDGEEKSVQRSDYGWSRHLRPRLSEETRKAMNEAVWSIKDAHEGYQKLSRRKTEIGRRAANHVVRRLRKLAKTDKVAIAVEDLNVRMFHGGGSRSTGWDNFFVAKRENRWFVQVLHKSFCDLALHRGEVVIEVDPARTSQTCPACGHCDPKNRSSVDREVFRCVVCGRTFHADLEVATFNIERVALTGESMPKGEEGARERGGGGKSRGGARGRNKLK